MRIKNIQCAVQEMACTLTGTCWVSVKNAREALTNDGKDPESPEISDGKVL